MYDLNSTNTNPTVNYDGIPKNVTAVGFQEAGKFMYTGGEDCSARIWDLRLKNWSVHFKKWGVVFKKFDMFFKSFLNSKS